MKFKINNEVFEKFPELVVYIPIIKGFDNSKTEAHEKMSLDFQKSQQELLRNKIAGIEELKAHLYISSYFDCFKKFGIDPTKSMPTHFALAKRVISGKDLPNINPMVNIYNSVSIKYLTPFGGEDLNTVYGDFELVLAQGNEHWMGIGDTEPKSPPKGNLIWQDEYDVSTVSLNWRQCDRTKLDENSKDGYFIMDGFKGVNDENIKTAAEEFIKIITETFGGNAELLVLDKENPDAEIAFESKSMEGVVKPDVTSSIKHQASKEIKKSDVKKIEQLKEDKIYNYPADSFEAKIQKDLYEVLLKHYQILDKTDLIATFKSENIMITKTPDPKLGDYSSSIALQKSKDFALAPLDFAQKLEVEFNSIAKEFKSKAVAPGFINFTITQSEVVAIEEIIKAGESYGKNEIYKGETWDFEHTSPNPNKAMHIGHLRNNLTGMAIGRLGEYSGANVIYDCMDNNRGIAISKLMWGFLKFGRIDKNETFLDIKYWFENQSEWINPTKGNYLPDQFMDEMYVKGAQNFEEDKEVEKIVRNMVVLWEANEPLNRALWKVVMDYSHEGQMRTLKRLGNKWDNIWHESEHYQQGKDLIEKGLKEGVFVRDQGAVITNLKSYNLPNTVVIKKDGTSLYITQDLALNILKKQKFHADKMFWVIGPEQALAMKQVYAVSEQLGIGKIDEFTHIAYGYMTINGQGKMSSRKGNVLFIDNVIDMIKSAIKEKLVGRNFTPEYQEEVSEKLALAALKYNTLKVSRLTNVAFDIDAATDFNGDSAIYILYGLVRAKSILHNSEFEKVDVSNLKLESSLKFSEPSSETLYKKILEFPSVVRLSIEQFAPNYVCLYLFQLAQCFSQFYDGVSVLKETDENSKLMKLKLLKAYEITVTNGCRLLGIEAVEKM